MRRLNSFLLAVCVLLTAGIAVNVYVKDHPLDISRLGQNRPTQAPAPPWKGDPPLWAPASIEGASLTYFDISGTTQAALKRGLENSEIAHAPDPSAPKGSINIGQISFATQGGTCRSPGTLVIPYTMVVKLPRWSPPAGGTVTVGLVRRWNALLQSIHVHEAGHASIYRDDMVAIQDHARHLGSCKDVIFFLDDAATWKQIDDDQAAYHKRIYADCRPELGCVPTGWMGW